MVSIHGYISGTSDISGRKCHRRRVASRSPPKMSIPRTGRPDASVKCATNCDALASLGEHLCMAIFPDVSQGLFSVANPDTSVVARSNRKLMVGCGWHGYGGKDAASQPVEACGCADPDVAFFVDQQFYGNTCAKSLVDGERFCISGAERLVHLVLPNSLKAVDGLAGRSPEGAIGSKCKVSEPGLWFAHSLCAGYRLGWVRIACYSAQPAGVGKPD